MVITSNEKIVLPSTRDLRDPFLDMRSWKLNERITGECKEDVERIEVLERSKLSDRITTESPYFVRILEELVGNSRQ